MSTLTVGTISEKVTDAGVAVDGVTLKDGGATFTSAVGVTGNTTITSGNLVIGTSGNGIDFSAVSGSASGSSSALLDDYEEGTFTPSVTFSSSAPSAGATTGFGTYQKVGNMVHCHLKASNFNVTGGSGDIQIQNMPFTARLDTDMDAFEGTCATGQISTIGYCTSSVLDNTSNCRIMESGNTTSEFRDTITTSECNHGASDFFIQVSYPVA